MKYKAMAAFAAASVVISTTQAGRTQSPTTHEGLELGGFDTRCCCGGTATAQTRFIDPHSQINPHGYFVELLTTGCGFAETEVEHLDTNFTVVDNKGITFNLTGPTDHFSVVVNWLDSHHATHGSKFTFSQSTHGNQYSIDNDQIPAGSQITHMAFLLNNENNGWSRIKTTQIDDIQNLLIGHYPVSYEVDHGVLENESSSSICGC